MTTDLGDLSYEPDLGRAAALIETTRPTRVLLLGKVDDLHVPDTDVRRATVPASPVPNGAYLFRTDDGWDAMLSSGGQPPGGPDTISEADATDGHPLLVARDWFDHLWGDASSLAAPAKFAGGDTVTVLGSDRIGRIERVDRMGDTWSYHVQRGDQIQRVTESSLRVAVLDEHDPTSWIETAVGSAADLSMRLTFAKLANPLTDTVYSYLSSKTVFRAYQFRPVLRMMQSDRNRLLIADEVGLGKTIEAGLIWAELEHRADLRRVLVVCPAVLVEKWRVEMRNRFDRELTVLDTTALRTMTERFHAGDDDRSVHGVVSLERLRTWQGLGELNEANPRFDLVIVDEAHYLRNETSRSHELGQLLSDWADALVFLSATPLNLGGDDLFNLLNLLAEEEFNDRAIFPLQIEPNRYLNTVAAHLRRQAAQPRSLVATLDGVASCELGAAVRSRPEYRELRSILDRDEPLAWGEVAAAGRLLAELNTLSSLITRTRKADVPGDRAVREPRMVDVDWGPDEAAFYQAVLDWARRRARAKGGIPGFVTQMPLRQAASCLPAMRQLLEERDPTLFSSDTYLGEMVDLEDWADTDDEMSVDEIREILRQGFARDTKFDRFDVALADGLRVGSGQAMVFSYFRRTLEYLASRLRERHRVRVMHGGTPMADRHRLMAEFREGRFDVLLCSEVGSEGLDFEFCNVVINYDLPWNPMRVEQRIGRLDRFGQTSEKIFIYNFHVPGTIETEIFERLYRRIRVFEESIGELEPILRDRFTDLQRIALDPSLSEAQRLDELARVEVAVEQQQRQLGDLEESGELLMGMQQVLVEGFDEARDRGRFVGPAEVEAFVRSSLDQFTGSRLGAPVADGIYELAGDKVLADAVSRGQGGRSGTRYSTGELTRMLRDEAPIPVTFDNDIASRTGVDLLSIRHPVVRACQRFLADAGALLPRVASVALPGAGRADGGVVVVYLAESTGARPSLELWPVAVSLATGEVLPDLGDAVMTALTTGSLRDSGLEMGEAVRRGLRHVEAEATRLQHDAEEDRRARNDALVDARMATTRASYDGKIARARETLAVVRQKGRAASIQRLHTGRIANLELRREERLAQLEAQRDLAVSLQPIAALVVHPDEPAAHSKRKRTAGGAGGRS